MEGNMSEILAAIDAANRASCEAAFAAELYDATGVEVERQNALDYIESAQRRLGAARAALLREGVDA
jgi:hypothetical protein